MGLLEVSLCIKVMVLLNDFRKEGMLCDVIFSVQGVLFFLYWNVFFVNSEFFKVLFVNDMKEKVENIVYMEEFEFYVME